jgi:hypothetical protein
MAEQAHPQGIAEGEGDELDEETIRSRAYEISQRAESGSKDENWHRAAEELRAERDGTPAENA